MILGDGARLFDEIGNHKLRLAGAQFRLRLTVEFAHGQPPNIALVNGKPVALTVTDSSTTSPDVSGVATGASAATTARLRSAKSLSSQCARPIPART